MQNVFVKKLVHTGNESFPCQLNLKVKTDKIKT